MEEMVKRCCGLDVHSRSIQACVRRSDPSGPIHEEVRSFGTTTRDILALADWLAAEGVTQVAMESTGVFWKPIYNLLEDRFTVLLVNARHVKHVPGRKTDVKDCQWLAQLLAAGLLTASFIPPRPQRELRDLTRQRTQLIGEKAAVRNRISKVLEDANIKIQSVASDLLGVSGRAMIQALIRGETDARAVAVLARMRLRRKIPELTQALEGKVTEHHRFLLRMHMDHVRYLEQQIETFNRRIEDTMAPFEDAIRRLDEVPGIDQRIAENLVAEIGTDMGRFPTAGHLASWAGMCPGNNESAGKQKSGRTNPANRWLRPTLVQAAWAASHSQKSYFHAQYRRLVGRRGKKRALVALGHSLLVVVYHLLKYNESYRDLGGDYFDRQESHRLARYHIRRLQALGYEVKMTETDNTIEEVAATG